MRRAAAIVAALLAACGGGAEKPGTSDGGTATDAVVPVDALAPVDAAAPDAAVPAPDARPPDAAAPDAVVVPDAALPDAAVPDAPPPDAAIPDAGPVLSLDVVAASLAIPIGESATTALAIGRGGDVGTVTLELVSPPAGVSAVFTPAEPPGGSATMRLSVAEPAALGPVVLTVKATGEALEATDTLTLDVKAATGNAVNGIVYDQNVVATGVKITITGVGTVTTNGSGLFTFPDVPRPYDLAVVSKDGKRVTRYVGLSRKDPTIYLVTLDGAIGFAGVKGSLPAGSPNVSLAFGAPGLFRSETLNMAIADDGTGYEGNLSWMGPGTATGTLYALRGKGAGAFDYGTLPVTLQRGVNKAGLNLTLAPVAQTGVVAATVTAAPGATKVRALAYVASPDGALLGAGTSASGDVELVVPQIPGSAIDLLALASQPNASSVAWHEGPYAPGDGGIAITLPSAPFPLEPANNVTIAKTTDFHWADVTGGVSVLQCGSADGEAYVVITTASSTQLPFDVIVSPTGKAFGWFVVAFGPYDSVDEMASAASPLRIESGTNFYPPRGQFRALSGGGRIFRAP